MYTGKSDDGLLIQHTKPKQITWLWIFTSSTADKVSLFTVIRLCLTTNLCEWNKDGANELLGNVFSKLS